MTSVSTIRTALSYHLLIAVSALIAMVLYYQSADPTYLGTTTSAGWARIIDGINVWIHTHVAQFNGEFSNIVSSPDRLLDPMKNAVK